MNIKDLLISSIKKTYLDLSGVDDYYIFWDSDAGKLKLSSYVIAHKSSTVSLIEMEAADLKPSNAILRDPSKLLKMLNITNENLNIDVSNNRLNLKDDQFDLEFVLCDPKTIGIKMPVIDEPLSYDVILDLNEEFNNKFLSAKAANNVEVVSIEIKSRIAKFELGESDSHSNKIRFSVETDGMFNMNKILFSSDVIEEIIKRNKNVKGKLYVCEDGLMKIEYPDDKIKSKYFLVALDKL